MFRDGSSSVDAHVDVAYAGGSGGYNFNDEGSQCERVHRTLMRIVKARGALDSQEAAALREAQQLRLWRKHGYNSLIEYMEHELGYSPRAAVERLRVANAITELPEIAAALEQGELPFSAARELTRIATPETESEWIDAARGKNLRELEGMVSGRRRGQRPSEPADPSLRKHALRFEVRPETYALWRQAKEVLERERGERLDDDAVIASMARQVIDGATGSERTRAPYQVAVTVCDECKRGWQDGGGEVVEMSRAAIERATCGDTQRIGSLVGGAVERATQDIPPAVRRKVLRRDHNRCVVPGCRSRNIDLHHIIPREHGGTNDESNLCSTCEGHHLACHEGTLSITGKAPDLTIVRKPHHALATATHLVETASALRSLGFKHHEVAAAMKETRTHVGSKPITLEQCIKIALSHCPKPTG